VKQFLTASGTDKLSYYTLQNWQLYLELSAQYKGYSRINF